MVFNSIVDCRSIYLFIFSIYLGWGAVRGDGEETNFIKKVNAKFQSWRRISIFKMNSIYKSTLSTFLWLNIDSHIQMQNHRLANEGDVYRDVANCTSKRCAKDDPILYENIFPFCFLYTDTPCICVSKKKTNDTGIKEERNIVHTERTYLHLRGVRGI